LFKPQVYLVILNLIVFKLAQPAYNRSIAQSLNAQGIERYIERRALAEYLPALAYQLCQITLKMLARCL
jgi:hypothetical protein